MVQSSTMFNFLPAGDRVPITAGRRDCVSTLWLLQADFGVVAEIPLPSLCKQGCLPWVGQGTDMSFPALLQER